MQIRYPDRDERPDPDMPLEAPKGISERDDLNRFTLTRRWYSPGLRGMAFFCVFWDGFLVFWYYNAYLQWQKGSLDVMMVIVPLLHLAVGIGLTYSTVAGFLNKTRLALTFDDLVVRHGPLPWIGNKKFPTLDITSISRKSVGRANKETRLAVVAGLHNGQSRTIVSWLPEHQARFIEHTLRQKLALTDSP